MRMELHCLYLLLTIICGSLGSEDPCDLENHDMFPESGFGSRNEICQPRVPPVCDYYLEGNWYVVDNATLLNRCPVTGNCGVAYPTWMDGGFPRVEDGVVNRTACIKMEGDCCKMNVTIRIRNCTSFFVYYLSPLPACPMAYCFESYLPCDPPTTTITSATEGSKGSSITDKHYTTTQVRATQSEGLITKNSNALLIGICAGLICLVLGCVVCVAMWMWLSGRLQFKRPLSALAKNQTTVFPHVTYVNKRDMLPPPYLEK